MNWRLRDWGVSRQRYWGCPIPVIHCEACGVVPVPDDRPAGAAAGGRDASTGRATRSTTIRPGSTWPARAAAGRRGGRPTRSTPSSTVPGISPASAARARTMPVTRAAVDHWMPVDQYIGGIEHAILHLLYSRFFTRAMKDDRPRLGRRAVRRPVHPGHGDPRKLPGRRRTLAVSRGGGEARRRHGGAPRRPASR